MSLESYDLTSIEDDQLSKTIKPNGLIIITKCKFIAIMTTILLVYGITLITISIQSGSKNHNSDNGNNFTDALKDLNAHVESLKSYHQFEKIEQFGYFKKLAKKMNYEDGQKACSKMFGHIIEGEFKSMYGL